MACMDCGGGVVQSPWFSSGAHLRMTGFASRVNPHSQKRPHGPQHASDIDACGMLSLDMQESK